jgi:hypothetical protein
VDQARDALASLHDLRGAQHAAILGQVMVSVPTMPYASWPGRWQM